MAEDRDKDRDRVMAEDRDKDRDRVMAEDRDKDRVTAEDPMDTRGRTRDRAPAGAPVVTAPAEVSSQSGACICLQSVRRLASVNPISA
jgi:hypothetical protein